MKLTVTTDFSTAADLYIKARTLLDAGDPAAAIPLLRDLHDTDPDFVLFRDTLAQAVAQEAGTPPAPAAAAEGSAPDLDFERAPAPGRFAGRYGLYPDLTGRRQAEGGLRLDGIFKVSQPGRPLVTIVTAVFQNEDSFQRCIDSVVRQTYPNVEYIIVDGGSRDGTVDLIRRNEDVVDYFISEPDKGIYSAMNKGIELAQGDYICLLNSDDVYEADYIEKAVALALSDPDQPDVVYTDYSQGDKYMAAQPIGPGVLLGHLNICHNTFLGSARAYDRIGPYDESQKIVSDAIWIRAAYNGGVRFAHLPEPLFTLTEGGLSSGNTEARRLMFIREVAQSYQRVFPDLSYDEAEELYLFRFNKARIKAVAVIARKHYGNRLFCEALRDYAQYCFAHRPNFGLGHKEAGTLFPEYIALCDLLGIDRKSIAINTKNGSFSDLLAQIDDVVVRRKTGTRRTVLHFVSVFSTPSETFIYDLLTRLDAEDDLDNFVLYEHEKLAEERPWAKKLRVPWNDYPETIAREIYRYFIDTLAPDAVIAHFAINEHRFHQRTAPLGLRIPTVVMTHGIDVFNLKKADEYASYVLDDLSQRADVVFTTVSNYLLGELTAAGVDPEKVRVVPNTVNPRYFAHRKTTGFYDRSRPLQVLSVGRLIDWKGHDHLLRALASFRDKCTPDVHLTIVYGNGDERLKPLQDLAAELGLTGHVTFEPFVDFSTEPTYFSRFDLFVHPSTYTSDALRKSETFGVAVLEAVAAGLPVISSDAGGLPEVIGTEDTPFARVVAHGRADAIFDAMAAMWSDGTCFADNEAYARPRLEAFDDALQTRRVAAALAEVDSKPCKVAMFSTSTIQGAGYAAYRLHMGLRKSRGVRPHIFTTVRNHENEEGVTVLKHPSGDNRNWSALQGPPKPGLTIFSVNQTHVPSDDLMRLVEPYDIVNLHWHARFLSAENIASLTWGDKPVVMTIRDMQPITGGCHFFHGCDKWQDTCYGCPQIDSAVTRFPGDLLEAKRANYNFDNLTLVALSRHTRDILRRTPSFNQCRIEHIPNSIETDVFRPYDRNARRRELGLPLDRKIIGYVPSFSSEVKGYKQLLEAFEIIWRDAPDLDPFVMLVGNKTPATEEISFDKKALGYISDNRKLAWAYSAADVIVVPSLEETFSNTTAEAIACGVPVVGFRTGAIPDLAVDGVSGYNCEVGNSAALAEGLIKTLTGPNNMRRESRHHAEAELTFMKQANRYEALFADLLARKADRGNHAPKVFNSFDVPGMGLGKIAAERVLAAKK